MKSRRSFISLKGIVAFVFASLILNPISVTAEDLPISCLQDVNLSLGLNCMSTLTAEDLLSESTAGLNYTLELRTAVGAIIPANILNENHLWTTVTGKVTNSAGNMCWGYIHVEDKLPPVISCADITIDCYDMNAYSATAVDACSDATISLLGEDIEVISCDDDFIKEVSQVYQATDSYGNTSSCSQSITLSKFDPSTIVWPNDFLTVDDTNLTCQDPINSEGTPDISVTGVPTSNGVAIFPYTDLYCSISVEYRDVVIVDFGCSKKLMRTWYVYEWSCNNTVEYNHVQTLEIDDTELPQIISCPTVLEYDADGSVGCDRTLELQLPSATDDCTRVIETDVKYDGGFINNATTNPVVTLSGSSVVTYTVYDACDNSASCSTLITIRDNLSPTALCDQNSVVSLRSDGTAIAHTATFDDGSFDDCDLYKSVVRRPNSNCDCERPRYDDMSYLGDHNGHFYYLSKWKTTAPWAFGLATGLGVEMLSLNTAEEAAWIVDIVTALADSTYVGLTDVNHNGSFSWPGHLAPTYTNWSAGQLDANGDPLVTGNYVLLNENGEWEIATGSDNLQYIIEVSDPCGFSDRVNFCCQDVGTEQMVILRTIDLSGRINECETRVVVQDKVAPIISCPKDFTIECGTTFDPNDSATYGVAQATDQCTSNITFVISNNLNSTCGIGTIQKIFTASDNNGSSSCTQTFHVSSATGYDPNSIDWPDDYEVANGCNGSAYLPGTLPVANAFPQYSVGTCDNVSHSYTDQVYSFAGPASDACRKIVRTWTVMDACSPEVSGVNPQVYQQAIKVNNNVGPAITGCAPLQVTSVNCNPAPVSFSVTALDDCAPTTNVSGTLNFYLYSGQSLTSTSSSVGNIIHFNQSLPVGVHSAVVSYTDFCGNTESCTKVITVTNTTTPTVACKSVSVNIQAMDLDNNPATPAINMAMVNPAALIESTSNPCNYTLNYSFSATDLTDTERVFDCTDRNTTQSLTVYVTDINGFGSSCTGAVSIQDNNSLCNMLIQNQVTLAGCQDASFVEASCSSSGPLVEFDITASSSNCTSSGNFSYSARIDLGADGTIDNLETGTSSTGYQYSAISAIGTHAIQLVVMDECGTSATCNKTIQVSCNTITPETGVADCEEDIYRIVDCGIGGGAALIVSFDIAYDNNNCGIPGDVLVVAKVDYFSDGTNDLREDILTNGTYNYNFPTDPGVHSLDITFTDPCGWVENCTKQFTVECQNAVSGAVVRGKVMTEHAEAVEEVMVQLEGSQLSQMTNETGSYTFPAMQVGGQYRINPSKDSKPLNGVSTLDLIHIQRHILGIERLGSPYKIIAADIDKSNSVNGVDLVELRKLILGIYEDFPNNDSWRMVDESQIFFDALNPFTSSIDENYIIHNLTADMEVDFIGVKVGDVNNTVELNANSAISSRSHINFDLIAKEKKYTRGENSEIVFSFPSDATLDGLQTSLFFDTDRVEVIELIPLATKLSAANFNSTKLQDGKLDISWDTNQADASSDLFFKVKVNILEDSWTSDIVEVDITGLNSEAYVSDEILRLKVNFEQDDLDNKEIKLYQNVPNPWTTETEIKYYLPADKEIKLSLYDINGRLIYQEQRRAEKGINKVLFSRSDLNVSGVLYYELVVDNFRSIEKMILLD